MISFTALILTVLAAAWRYADGRGKPWRETALRNAAGIVIALGCGWVGVGGWFGLACGGLAALTLIAGYTKWESWLSLVRYGGPTLVVATVAYFGGASAAGAAVYAVGGFFVGTIYVIQHRYIPWKYSTVLSEISAGAIIIGGVSWI